VQHGIDAVRKILPNCLFSTKTEAGVEALRAYKRRYDDLTKSFANDPNHDWSSQGADGFRYFALGVRDYSPRSIIVPRTEIQIVEAPKICLDDLWADRASSSYSRSRI
jgi:hypothetical protein